VPARSFVPGRITPSDFRRVIRALPLGSILLACGAVACFFSVMGFVGDVQLLGQQPLTLLAITVLFSAVLSIVYLFAIAHSWRALALVVVLHIGGTMWLSAMHPAGPQAAVLDANALRGRLAVDAVGITAAVSLGYTCALIFTVRESARFQAVQAEIRLAGEIHKALVPHIAGTIGSFEYVGLSIASGEVGGDLVDVVTTPEGWVAYVADVSGHGVRSGVLMGMVKSAARMALRRSIGLGTWLGELNAVLFPLKAPNMFVTMAAVAGDAADRVTFAVAGHLPIIVVRAAGSVEEHTTPQVPIGIFEERAFDAQALSIGSGDLIALLTDGLVEVFDRKDEELGLEPLEALLRDQRANPLASMAEALIVRSRAHGTVLDDQTVLLLRRVA